MSLSRLRLTAVLVLQLAVVIPSALCLTSPCALFQYKTTVQSATTYKTWSATLELPARPSRASTNDNDNDNDSSIDIVLDRGPVTHLSAHNFEVISPDQRKFHLSAPKWQRGHLHQDDVRRVHVTVEFGDQVRGIPLVEEIRQNGVRICPAEPAILRTDDDTRDTYDSTRRTGDGGGGGAGGSATQYQGNNNNNYDSTNYNYDDNRRVASTTTRYFTTTTSSRRPATTRFNTQTTTTTTARRTSTPRTGSGSAAGGDYFPGDLHFSWPPVRPTTSRPAANPHSEECGTIAPRVSPLIVSGTEAYPGQFPWHTALYISQGIQLKYTCGGNLIGRRAILTAAHCVTLRRSTATMNAEHLLVYLGKSDLMQWQGQEFQAKVASIEVHPDYNETSLYADLALLRLKENVQYSDYIRPLCLWQATGSGSDLKSMIGKVGHVPGWGYNEQGVVDTELSYVEMPIVTHEKCIWSNREVFSRITNEKAFCAGFRNGSSVCNGDSGGGLIFKRQGRWHLRGIVSVSVAMQNHFLCDPLHYVVFTDVAKYDDWIADNI